MKISLIHPSRQRPKLAKQVYDNWMGNAASPENIEYILSIDESDIYRAEYQMLFPDKTIVVSDNKTAIEAINNAANYATGDLFIVVSDDFDCPKNWDADLLKYLNGKSDILVKTYDGLQPWIMTLPIMDRVYYERFGYIYNPEYKHMFCDTEMTCVGDLLDRTIIVPMEFKHRHYSQNGGITKDAVSVKNDATWGQGEKLYLTRLMTNFGLKDEDVKGVLRCDMAHYRWLQSKGIQMEQV